MDATGPWQPVPVLVAAAPPGGPIEQSVFLDFSTHMRRGLAAALPLDGVYLASHGASSATGDEDSDGTIAAMIRQVVGPAVPVVCSHDLHCNVSERLVECGRCAGGLPDQPACGHGRAAAELADLLREMLAGVRTATAFVRLPLAPPSVTLLTAAGPYAETHRRGRGADARRSAHRQCLGRRRLRLLRPAEMRDDGDGHRARRRCGRRARRARGWRGTPGPTGAACAAADAAGRCRGHGGRRRPRRGAAGAAGRCRRQSRRRRPRQHDVSAAGAA